MTYLADVCRVWNHIYQNPLIQKGKELWMAEKKENRKHDAPRDSDKKDQNSNSCPSNNIKSGWSHLINGVKYSGGPGDNIYIFG